MGWPKPSDIARSNAAPPAPTNRVLLMRSGAAKCWGYNSSGQLGTGDTTSHRRPHDVIGLPAPLAQISAGGDQTCGVTTGGAAYCWGGPYLGGGTTASNTAPVGVSGLS
jgi:alpha-tubulin suppressor-like RCC1 family protein